MIFGSVCSGIEAASVAWHPLGWRAAWLAEIEPFPSVVLAHHYPETPNYGDFTRLIQERPADVDLLVGGTPCQSFSVAGLRGGLTDHRGNLALAFMALVDVLRPRWVVWENVPGVLSSNGGRDFGSILGALGKLGYGFAYRVLDAQYFGLAQRRKRVFVVGHLGDWRRAAAVLFEPESVRRDSPPRRETGARAAGSLGTGASGGGGWRVGADEAAASHVVPEARAYGGNNTTGSIEVATAVNAKGGTGRTDFESETFVAHTLRGTGHDASEDGTGRRAPLVPVFTIQDARVGDKSQNGKGWRDDGVAFTLDVGSTPAVAYQCHGSNVGEMGTLRKGSGSVAGGVPFVAFAENSRSEVRLEGGDGNVCGPLNRGGGKPGQGTKTIASPTMGVRRLTPREMERLQGFPDDYTAIPWRGKDAKDCPDGPRAKALGNSMAVPCMSWIGERIALVDAISVGEAVNP